ncbi:MAG: hypothetical protein U0Y10_21150 [Spirosomataceae bacterium]
MNNFFSTIQGIQKSRPLAFMVLACALFNVGLFLMMMVVAKQRFKADYQTAFKAADTTMSKHIDRVPFVTAKQATFLSNEELATIRNQYFYLQTKKDYHEGMLSRFYALYFAITTCALLASVLIGGLLAYIANLGWSQANLKIKTFFVTMGIFTTLYGSVLNVFNLKKNAENNLKFFLEYKGIQIEIYDYLTTSGKYLMSDDEKQKPSNTVVNGDTIIAPKFAIHHINHHIVELNSVFYSISDDAILKSGDLTKLLGQSGMEAGR